MTGLTVALKIKIVVKAKGEGAELSAPGEARDIRPYHLRVSRDHGGSLFTLEGDDGQLYLAVPKLGTGKAWERAREEAAAEGRAYESPSHTRWRRRSRVRRGSGGPLSA